jgi:hypothetical protein
MFSASSKILSITNYLRRKVGVAMKGIGLCAIFSPQGDWAFDYPLALATHHKVRLNIFHFLESPYTFGRDVVFVDAKREEVVKVTPQLDSKEG